MRTMSNFNYNGPSMKPLLKPGDGLIVDLAIPFTSLRKGDVICFKSPEKPIHVTHRIVTITRRGFITRGDNNTQNDPYVCTALLDPVLLTHIRRGRKTIRIRGGIIGMMIHHKNQIRRFILHRMVSPLIITLKSSFGFLRHRGCLCHLQLLEKNISAISYKRSGKKVWMLFAGRRWIGHLKSDGTWYVRFPWKYFIDPRKKEMP